MLYCPWDGGFEFEFGISVDESHPSGKFNLWEYNTPNSPPNDSCSIPRPVVWYSCAYRRLASISCGVRFVDKCAAYPLSCTFDPSPSLPKQFYGEDGV
ncbi:uncharacterized protein K444DRAFT_620706 [Hyaloscypha bicolor E]|uniref:Uncharacterized protein n=1 Tax=Hyaloscypha bicolor E TaxID=1095630 RepID=A0A2J6SLH4_9HELO|nr:uncharacterized protein K444DRAFT_620706 [Hyaloscypha bicolor E]PMD51623.1 hypothetical protein K444DRAFT_620706 [Hyaloscypha bicolor E]